MKIRVHFNPVGFYSESVKDFDFPEEYTYEQMYHAIKDWANRLIDIWYEEID